MLSKEELAALKGLRGPSQTEQEARKEYMTVTSIRTAVDAHDAEHGTQIGKKLKAGFYGQTEAPTPQPAPQPTAVELAAVVKKFPKERCHNLFVGSKNKNGDTQHAEIASKLTPEEYKEAKTAARFWGIISDGGLSSVRFNYETKRDRDAKRAAREATAKDAERKASEALPPGINRDAKGDLLLVDEVAFNSWKAEKAANAEAIKFLEDAAT
jgi:hypothetical protein